MTAQPWQESCPIWCTNGDDCSMGDHGDDKVFVPATGTDKPSDVSPDVGATFPVVGVGMDWSEPEWTGPALVLWLTGVEGLDAEAYLHPHQARAVVAALQERLDVLEKVEGSSGF